MTAINEVTDLSHDGDIAVITLDSPPVNALSANVRDGLYDAFEAAIASDAKSIVLICAAIWMSIGILVMKKMINFDF